MRGRDSRVSKRELVVVAPPREIAHGSHAVLWVDTHAPQESLFSWSPMRTARCSRSGWGRLVAQAEAWSGFGGEGMKLGVGHCYSWDLLREPRGRLVRKKAGHGALLGTASVRLLSLRGPVPGIRRKAEAEPEGCDGVTRRAPSRWPARTSRPRGGASGLGWDAKNARLSEKTRGPRRQRPLRALVNAARLGRTAIENGCVPSVGEVSARARGEMRIAQRRACRRTMPPPRGVLPPPRLSEPAAKGVAVLLIPASEGCV